ncbi:cyclase family protein [Candidatus Micrarchaeota archaeon]|nr:cyclase family protein [Candidatus Micrarchaeota archaeon]
MRIHELSHRVYEGTPVFPGDSLTRIEGACSIGREGFSTSRITVSSHAGTHVETPFHFFPEGKRLDELPVDAFFGNAYVFDVRGENQVKLKHLDFALFNKAEIALFFTGHSRLFGEAAYFEDWPFLSEELVELLPPKLKIVGTDAPSVDKKNSCEIHKKLLEKGILVVENLTGLERIAEKNVKFYAIPLKISAEAFSVRAFAIEE